MSEIEASIDTWRGRMVSTDTGPLDSWRRPFEAWFAEGETLRQAILAEPAETAARDVSWRIRLAQAEGLLVGARRRASELFDVLTRPSVGTVRLETLMGEAIVHFSRLGFDEDQIRRDAAAPLREKSGADLFQGVLLSALLADPAVAGRILRDMRRPKPTSLTLLDDFVQKNSLDLGSVSLDRVGHAGMVTFTNEHSLNAEDDGLLEAFETAVDLVLLHPGIRVGVLRGGVMSHAKYKGRRVFCSGINLTLLLQGQISYLYFVVRELGVMNKIYRGLAMDPTDDVTGIAFEKPWIGVIDAHAIGGGVQMLLILDYVLAEEGAFFAVPARTEGFIPGVANLRLPRLVGVRTAHRIVDQGLRFTPKHPIGQSLIDRTVPRENVDAALADIVARYRDAGSAGAIANRRAFRTAEEPQEQFRAYMARFCLEQARCLYDPSSADHLSRVWTQRKSRSVGERSANGVDNG